MTTRELACACLAAREFDDGDPVLVRTMVAVPSNTLKKAVRRGVRRLDGNQREGSAGRPVTRLSRDIAPSCVW